MARGVVAFGLLASVILHVLDQATDVFAATLFFFEGNVPGAALTFAFVMLPGFCVAVTELKHLCSRDVGSLVKAAAYLLLSPVWAVVLHLYSFCDHRYAETAFFFKALEGFVEAGPQLALQLSFLIQGTTTGSKRMVIDRHISGFHNDEVNATLRVFGRVYDADARYWFGWIHLLSVLVSFASILSTTIVFNAMRPRTPGNTAMEVDDILRCDSRACGKMLFGVPFYFSTLIFRTVSVALLVTFLRMWAGVVLFAMFFLNFLAALFIGDDFHRATTYAAWSMLVPAGFGTDPTAFLGHTKLPLLPKDPDADPDQPPSRHEIERSLNRTKYFLTMHVLASIFVVGTSVAVTYTLVYSDPSFYFRLTVLSPESLSTLFLPLLGLSLGMSVLTVRPYHRVDCSGGEAPKGNIIV